MAAYSITVVTTQYIAAHGKSPKGTGSWAFTLSETERGAGEFFSCWGTYSQAVKAAKARARQMAEKAGRRSMYVVVGS